MVIGELRRVPGELLSPDETGLPVLNDAFHDPNCMDEAATEFKQRHRIRERARQLAVEETSRETMKRAVKAAPHVCRQDSGCTSSVVGALETTFTPHRDGWDLGS